MLVGNAGTDGIVLLFLTYENENTGRYAVIMLGW